MLTLLDRAEVACLGSIAIHSTIINETHGAGSLPWDDFANAINDARNPVVLHHVFSASVLEVARVA
jgi:hypothetical protein